MYIQNYKILIKEIKKKRPGACGSCLSILATQEAEIMRIEVLSQPREIAPETLSRK
jgi:hypothetical protein